MNVLFRKKIKKSCSYCIHGTKLDENMVLCAKRGMVSIDGKCRKFRYDPFKRVPLKTKTPDFKKYDDVDYSL